MAANRIPRARIVLTLANVGARFGNVRVGAVSHSFCEGIWETTTEFGLPPQGFASRDTSVAIVLIEGLPAARVGDVAICVGQPDSILKGSAAVMIMGQPAARMGDLFAQGGTIVLGLPTVLIGG